MTREQRLAIALQAAIRWPYMNEMWLHIRHGVHDDKYDGSYLNDIASIADGVSAASEIGIVALTDSQVKAATR